MTYRELLNLYKQGKLDDVRKKKLKHLLKNKTQSVNFSMKKVRYQNFLIWKVRMQRIRKMKNGYQDRKTIKR